MATSRVVDGVAASPRRAARRPHLSPRIRERRRARTPRSRPCGPQDAGAPRLVHQNAESASNQSHTHLHQTTTPAAPKADRQLLSEARQAAQDADELWLWPRKLKSAVPQTHEVHGADAARAERRRERSWLTMRRIATQ